MEGLATALAWLVSTAMSVLALSFRALALAAIIIVAAIAIAIGATRLHRPRDATRRGRMR
jgi:hypothetical protein